MSTDPGSEVLLSFEPPALERCYLVADILHDHFEQPYMEYALLGLSTNANPFHVVATLLLPGQRVTSGTVQQPGRQVLRMRGEIEALSNRMQRRLLPIVFIHRHPSRCDASATDDAFIRGVFVDQVSTLVSFERVRVVDPADRHCDCSGMQQLLRDCAVEGKGLVTLRSECGIAFSLIVNRERDHRLYAVRKDWCPSCGRPEVRYTAARLAADPRRWVPELDRAALRRRLEEEIEAKITFRREGGTTERIQ